MLKFTDQTRETRRFNFQFHPRQLVLTMVLPLLLVSQQAAGDEQEREDSPSSASRSTTTQDDKDQLKRSILDAAQQAERKRDNVNALSYYRSLYERHPNNIDVIVGMSRSLRHLGRSTEAEALVERALKTIDRNHVLLAEAGKVRLSLGKAMPAIDSLSRAESLGAKAWDIYTALAVAYDRVGMFDQAEARYRKALELSPDNAVVLNNFALSRAQAGDLDKAIENLQRASALPEATPRMRQNLALFFAIKGDLKAAEDLVRRDLPPKDAAANMAYYRQLRAQVEAEGDQTKLLGMTPKIMTASASGTATGASGTSTEAVKADTVVKAAPAKTQTRVPMAKVEAVKVEAAKPLPAPVAKNETADDEKAPAEIQKAALSPAASKTPPAETERPQADQAIPALKQYDFKTVAAARKFDDGMAAKPKKQPQPKNQPQKETKPTQSVSLNGDGVAYRLQLGAFRDAERADTLASKLMKSHETILGMLKLEVEDTVVANQGNFYRVVSQEFADRDLGKKSCEMLKKDGFSCLVARRN